MTVSVKINQYRSNERFKAFDKILIFNYIIKMKATKRKVVEPINFSPAPAVKITRAKADFCRLKIKINNSIYNNYKYYYLF